MNPWPGRALFVLAALGGGSAIAQELDRVPVRAAKVQPTATDVGTVAVGATVEATFTVHCGSEKVTVPLLAKVVAMPKGGSRVLVAESPFVTFSAEDPATFDGWRKVVEGEHAVMRVSLTAPAEQPFAAMASVASGGEIVAVGESLWWNQCGKSPGFARLVRNLLSRAPRLR